MNLETNPTSVKGLRVKVAAVVLFVVLTLLLPLTSSRIAFLAGTPFSAWGSYVALTIEVVIAVICLAVLVRAARRDRKQLPRISLGLSLGLGFVSAVVGGSVTFMARSAPEGFPDRLGGPLPEEAKWVGIALQFAAIAIVFIGLTLNPSSSTELKRKIEVEASSVALGTCLFFFYVYRGLETHVGLPKFNEFIAMASILVSYLAARAAVRFRYR